MPVSSMGSRGSLPAIAEQLSSCSAANRAAAFTFTCTSSPACRRRAVSARSASTIPWRIARSPPSGFEHRRLAHQTDGAAAFGPRSFRARRRSPKRGRRQGSGGDAIGRPRRSRAPDEGQAEPHRGLSPSRSARAGPGRRRVPRHRPPSPSPGECSRAVRRPVVRTATGPCPASRSTSQPDAWTRERGLRRASATPRFWVATIVPRVKASTSTSLRVGTKAPIAADPWRCTLTRSSPTATESRRATSAT